MRPPENSILLADISGYTRFMTAPQKALAHRQMIFSELLNAVLEHVALPLSVAKLEGDAVFLSTDAAWPDRATGIRLPSAWHHHSVGGPDPLHRTSVGRSFPAH